ncbi:hypothetical protein CO615_04680 [Lysobacteraceae bacterium NML75-0749]|nr:hypothetical protein CO615_04680 [Xanthomonadaceae bacterium NML75-0749]
MKERPLDLKAKDIRLILAGKKTCLHRMMRPQPVMDDGFLTLNNQLLHDAHAIKLCPYGQPGNQLWIRETWCETLTDLGAVIAYRAGGCIVIGRSSPQEDDHLIHDYSFAETPEPDFDGWQSSREMPRWASRLLLEITNVRTQHIPHSGCREKWFWAIDFKAIKQGKAAQ